MWTLYDTIIGQLPGDDQVLDLRSADHWTVARLRGGNHGMAMTTFGNTRAPLYKNLIGLSCQNAAQAIKSWNLPEATAAMAVVNACYNTPARLDALGCREPYERYCTHAMDLSGKTVGLIGHLKMPADTLRLAREVYILERHPHPGDFPDSACEYLLPKCDIVLITGSSLINKTLPRLLELCRNAYTILTGPTVPMCPELLGCGIQRLAGMVVTDPQGAWHHVTENLPGPPYPYGETFLLTEDRL